MIYIALIKSKDVDRPSKLVVRDDEKEMKDYLLSIPAIDVVKTFVVFDGEKKLTRYYSLKDLVKFLRD